MTTPIIVVCKIRNTKSDLKYFLFHCAVQLLVCFLLLKIQQTVQNILMFSAQDGSVSKRGKKSKMKKRRTLFQVSVIFVHATDEFEILQTNRQGRPRNND